MLSLRPQFLTHDSYHYLDLSISPRIGDTHPLAFGYLLKFLATIAGYFSPPAFANLGILWNSVCLSISLFFPLKKALLNPAVVSYKDNAVGRWCYGLVIGLSVFILISNLLLSNAFWSEMTSLLQLSIMIYVSRRYIHTGYRRGSVVGVAVFVVAYHTRYLMIVFPFSVLLVSGVVVVKARSLAGTNESGAKAQRIRMLLLPGLMIASLLGSNLIPQRALPHAMGEGTAIGQGLSLSMQCALRCRTKMYETDCSTPEETRIVKESLCRDLVHGLVDLGKPIVKYSN